MFMALSATLHTHAHWGGAQPSQRTEGNLGLSDASRNLLVDISASAPTGTGIWLWV